MWFGVTQFLNGTDQQIKKMLKIRLFFFFFSRLESFVERKQIQIIGLPASLESGHLIFPRQWRSRVFTLLLCLQMCHLFPVPGHQGHENTYVMFRAEAKRWIRGDSPTRLLDSSRPAVEEVDGGSLPACRARCFLHRRPPCRDPEDRSGQSIPDQPQRSSRSWPAFWGSRDTKDSASFKLEWLGLIF